MWCREWSSGGGVWIELSRRSWVTLLILSPIQSFLESLAAYAFTTPPSQGSLTYRPAIRMEWTPFLICLSR
jgi:hypothetical protein